MSSSIVCCDLSGWALIELILFCHVLWWLFYFFLIVVTGQNEEWCCRVLTLVHGCLISYSAIKEIILNKIPIDFQSIPLSPTKKNYLSYMLSYFLFDFGWIHFYGNEAWIIYAHHIASITIIINVLLRNYGGGGVSYGVAGLEFTNPYLQLRWFLRSHGYLYKPIHKITELWFMFLFFAIRVVGGTVLLYYALMVSNTDVGIKLSFLCIYGISLVLQWQIFVYFKKKYLRSGNMTRDINFITSRVSISPYFQRRTLDNANSQHSFPDAPNPLDDTLQELGSGNVQQVSSLISTKSLHSTGDIIKSVFSGNQSLLSEKNETPPENAENVENAENGENAETAETAEEISGGDNNSERQSTTE